MHAAPNQWWCTPYFVRHTGIANSSGFQSAGIKCFLLHLACFLMHSTLYTPFLSAYWGTWHAGVDILSQGCMSGGRCTRGDRQHSNILLPSGCIHIMMLYFMWRKQRDPTIMIFWSTCMFYIYSTKEVCADIGMLLVNEAGWGSSFLN